MHTEPSLKAQVFLTCEAPVPDKIYHRLHGIFVGWDNGWLFRWTDGWMDGHVVHALEEIIEEIPKFVSRTTLIPGDTNSCATVLKSSPTLKNLVRKCSI